MTSTITFHVGDVRDVLAAMPDSSVDLLVTSPPFLALRSYLPEGHPDKHREIGSEPTPAAFLDTMLGLTADWRRVVADWGSIAVEIGDTYANAAPSGNAYGARPSSMTHKLAGQMWNSGEALPGATVGPGWPMAKSLCGIPTLYTWSLAYGRNLLTGTPSPAGQWRVRNLLTWTRPNPPVGCVDIETEALTPDGWKRHDELNDGDLIAAYDPASDSCRFQPAKFVRWHRENETMIAIDKRKTSQRLTFDHRCLVRTRKRPDPFVVLAGDLRNDQQMLLTARLEEVPGPEPVSEHRAELLGWFIAEGTPHGYAARIRQSRTTNPAKVDRIRDLLMRDGADFIETTHTTPGGYEHEGHQLTTLTVKGELAEWLNLHHKRLPMHYVTTWPTRTVRALWMGLIDGDGHRRRDGGTLFFQKDRQVCDAVQVLALRLGLRATVTRQDAMGGWQVTIGDAEHYESSRWTKVRKWDETGIPTEQYTGVVWCPMVETSFWLARRAGRTFVTGNSLGDKFRPATSFVTVACVSDKRWFDLDAVRTEAIDQRHRTTNGPKQGDPREVQTANYTTRVPSNAAGAPPLDWWDANDWQPLHRLPTQPYKGSHYAAFPVALPARLIEAMCPREVCSVCGEGRRRIVEAELIPARNGGTRGGKAVEIGNTTTYVKTERQATTLGWTDCGHDTYRPGIVLDPFGGSGTTALAAAQAGRDAVLIDIDHRNVDLARHRIADAMQIVHETVDGDTWTWTVDPGLPGLKGEHPDQLSLLGDIG